MRRQPKRSGNQSSEPAPDARDAEMNLWCTISVNATLLDRVSDPLKGCTWPERMNTGRLLLQLPGYGNTSCARDAAFPRL